MDLLAERERVVATLLPVIPGFAPEVVRAGLEAEVASWSAQALAYLEAELPDGWRRAAPRQVLIIAARTLPASSLRQCLLARRLGARVRLKCAQGQGALAEALARLDRDIIPTPFSSDDRAALARAVGQVDSVVVLGSDETVAAVRVATPPGKGFAPHGHKVSAAWFGAEPSDDEVRGLAEDLLAWDQAGCLAPQVVWCEGSPRALAERLRAVLPELEAELPLADLHLHRAARHRLVPLVAMLGGEVLGTPTTALAILPDATFRPSPGPRMLWLLPAEPAALERIAPVLSTLARTPLAATPTLASRLCAPGEMQRPPLGWHQDGLHPLASLLVPAALEGDDRA